MSVLPEHEQPQTPPNVTADDMAKIFTGPVEGRDYVEMPKPTPPPCPDWCVRTSHKKHIEQPAYLRVHRTRNFAGDAAWLVIDAVGSGIPMLSLSLLAASSDFLTLDSGHARMLAAMFECGLSTHEALAAALRQAADELDRITSSGGEGS